MPAANPKLQALVSDLAKLGVSQDAIEFLTDEFSEHTLDDLQNVYDNNQGPTTGTLYEYRDIWAEESGAATNDNTQWSYGNGATGFIGLPIDAGWEVEAMYFQSDIGGSAAESLSVHLVDFTTPSAAAPVIATISLTAAGAGVDNNAYLFEPLATPVAVPTGAVLGFRTGTEVGTWSDMRVGARLRREISDYVVAIQ